MVLSRTISRKFITKSVMGISPMHTFAQNIVHNKYINLVSNLQGNINNLYFSGVRIN